VKVHFLFLATLGGLAVAAGYPPPAIAQAIGPDFRVNSHTTQEQAKPALASTADAGFVVVWQSYGQDSSTPPSRGVFGQRYDSRGLASGLEFPVNTYTLRDQNLPSAACAASGYCAVAWHSSLQDGSDEGIFGQRYDPNGLPAGPEFRVNSYTLRSQNSPSVAAAADGRFVAAWASYGQDGDRLGVFGQRYDSSGLPTGPEFRANSYTTGDQRPGITVGSSVVSVAADGRFVVVWESARQDDGAFFGVFGQRYDSNGLPTGPEFRVNSYTPWGQYAPAVSSVGDGRLVVVWESRYQDGSGYGIFGQRYDANGLPTGPEFRVNSHTTGSQRDAAVASDSDGRFVVVWESFQGASSAFDVLGQRYDPSGAPLGSEFRVNGYATGDQRHPAVAAAPDGRFVVAWESPRDGSGSGIFGRRFHMDIIFADSWEEST
jgi:hypothetical protein